MENRAYRIAGLVVCISFADSAMADADLLSSCAPFEVETDDTGMNDEILLRLTVDNDMKRSRDCELIRSFDTGNGDTTVYRLSDGGYQYIIGNLQGEACCLLEARHRFSECRCALRGNKGMRHFGLNNALMMAFAFAGSYRQTLLIHASCVKKDGWAYPFIAKSGTGKSTHTGLWMQYIEGCELLNDDNPALRIVEGQPIVFGSPWSGKTPCYRNISAPLGAMTRIERSPVNKCERLTIAQAFASLLPACSSMQWDPEIHANNCNTISAIIGNTPFFTMHCRPDREAALLCHQTIGR